jgi:ribose 5-phosphate isomerase A
MTSEIINPKQAVAIEAAKLIEPNMVVGLGTGSTANFFIEALASRQREEGLNVITVSSSAISAVLAQHAGLPVVAIENLSTLDIYVDGADEISPDLSLLKGRGQDLVKEKLLASHANAFHVLVDESKLVEFIGEKHAIPVEVLPEAWRMVATSLESWGVETQLRKNANGDNVAVTASGSYVLDCNFKKEESTEVAMILDSLPGVVEHGIFADLATAVLVGREAGVEVKWR